MLSRRRLLQSSLVGAGLLLPGFKEKPKLYVSKEGFRFWYVGELNTSIKEDTCVGWCTRINTPRGPLSSFQHHIKGALLHREDGPAAEYLDKGYEWFQNGFLHRPDGGPTTKGTTVDDVVVYEWYWHGIIHRVGAPARTGTDNREEWWDYALLHRLDGPALISNFPKGKFWFQNGVEHREDGPAKIFANGRKEYWEHGKYCYAEEPLRKAIKKDPALLKKVEELFNV